MSTLPSWIQATTGLLTLVTAVLGLCLVKRQLKAVDRTIQSNTNAQLASQSYGLLKFVAEHPKVYEYIYKGKVPAEDYWDKDDCDNVVVRLAAAMLSNYLENLTLQKANILPETWLRWRRFIVDTYRSSPAVQWHLTKYEKWYSPQLIHIVSYDAGDKGTC
jgi:hypothetical protein